MYCVHVPGQIPCEQEPEALGAVHPGLHVPQGARPARVGQGHVGGGPQGHGGAGGVLGGGVDFHSRGRRSILRPEVGNLRNI